MADNHERLMERARGVKVGAAGDPDADMGPLVTAAARDRVKGLVDSGVAQGVDRKGSCNATIQCGRPSTGRTRARSTDGSTSSCGRRPLSDARARTRTSTSGLRRRVYSSAITVASCWIRNGSRPNRAT